MDTTEDHICVSTLPPCRTKPGSAHPLELFCAAGHPLAMSKDIYRIVKKEDGGVTIWLRSVVANALRPVGERSLHMVRTLEVQKLSPSRRDPVFKQNAVCAACRGRTIIAWMFEGYEDCSANSVTVGQLPGFEYRCWDEGSSHLGGSSQGVPRNMERQPLLVQLRYNGLMMRWCGEGSADSLEEMDLRTSDRDDNDRHLEGVFQSIELSEERVFVFGSDLNPPNLNDLWKHKWDQRKLYALSSSVTLYFAEQFRNIESLVRVAGDFLNPHAGGQGAQVQRVRHRIKHHLFGLNRRSPETPGERYIQIIEELAGKFAVVSAERQDRQNILLRELDCLQMLQMGSETRMPFRHPILHAIFRTRNVLAHSKDQTDREKRHILRLVVEYVGDGSLHKANHFLRAVVVTAQLSQSSSLFRAIDRCESADERSPEEETIVGEILVTIRELSIPDE